MFVVAEPLAILFAASACVAALMRFRYISDKSRVAVCAEHTIQRTAHPRHIEFIHVAMDGNVCFFMY